MRNRPSRQRHGSYGFFALTDFNYDISEATLATYQTSTVQPLYRVQSMDISSDYTTETLLELANDGYVQVKENTPVFTLTVGGNQVAQEIEDASGTANDIHALQWLALIANGDSVGDQSQTVFAIGEPLKFHESGGNSYDSGNGETYTDEGDDCIMNVMGDNTNTATITIDAANDWAAFEFLPINKQKKMIVRSVAVKMQYSSTAGDLTGSIYAHLYLGDGTDPTTNYATSNPVDVTTLETASADWVEFEFPIDCYPDKSPTNPYWIVIEASGVSNLDASDKILITTYSLTGSNGNSSTSTDGGSSWTPSATVSVEYSLGWEWDLSEFDTTITSQMVDCNSASVDPDTGFTTTPTTVDILVPVKGLSELQRVQVFHQAAVTSISWSFDVGGVATFESTLECDNQSMFIDDRKVADIIAITANSTNLSEGTTATIEGTASTACDIVNFYNPYDWDVTGTDGEVWEVYWNGVLLKQATSAADLNSPQAQRHCGSIKWSIPDSETDQIAFTNGTIDANDVIRIVYDPVVDPTWASYRLVSEPGDQGGVYKGELDISLLTDTTRPRVIEGLKVIDASGSDTVVQILPGTCYLKNTSTDELEMFRFFESMYYNIENTNADATDVVYVIMTMEGGVPTIYDINFTDSGLTALDGYDLILATVTIGAGPVVSTVTDAREFHRSKMHLIQSATLSADLGREVVQELGNEKDVERSLNQPIPVTVDVTAKDSDEELNVLIHAPATSVDSEVAHANISYTATTLVHSGKNFTSEGLVRAGDIIIARGSKAIVSSVGTTTLNVYSWYGDIPPQDCAYAIYRGILKADEMDDDIGVQVNLYVSNDRDEYSGSSLDELGDKRVVIESIQARTASDSLSISTGGDGEMSFSLNTDNLRAMIVAQTGI